MVNSIQIKIKLLLVVLLMLTSLSANSTETVSSIELPDFNTNNKVKLSSFSGQYLYIDFWASWCTTCIKSFPFIARLQEQYGDKNFTVVAINVDRYKSDAVKFLSNRVIEYPMLYDNEGIAGIPLGVKTLPVSILVDPKGKIIHRHTGFDEEYMKFIEEKLRKKLTAL